MAPKKIVPKKKKDVSDNDESDEPTSDSGSESDSDSEAEDTPPKKKAKTDKKKPGTSKQKKKGEVVDLTTEATTYPYDEYRLSKRHRMVFEKVEVEPCKKTGKKGFSYEALTLKRVPEEDTTKKGKGKGKKKKDGDEEEDTWTYSMNTSVTPSMQKALTLAVVKAGLSPFIPKSTIEAFVKEHGCGNCRGYA